MNLNRTNRPHQRPIEKQLERIHSVPRLLRLSTMLLVCAAVFAVLIGALASSTEFIGDAGIPALLVCMIVIAVAKCLFIFAAYSRCPMCGRLFFVQWPAERSSQPVASFIPRLLDPNPSCVHSGFQP